MDFLPGKARNRLSLVDFVFSFDVSADVLAQEVTKSDYEHGKYGDHDVHMERHGAGGVQLPVLDTIGDSVCERGEQNDIHARELNIQHVVSLSNLLL